MQQHFAVVFFFTCLATSANGLAWRSLDNDSLSRNPIRKVVNMLQKMGAQLEKESKEEKELYENFMCYCKNSDKDLKGSIGAAMAKIPKLTADIESESAEKASLLEELKQNKADRTAAREAIGNAQAIRDKEHEAYVAESTDQKGQIEALTQALAALAGGSAGSFLQSSSAQVLRKLSVSKVEMTDEDRDDLVAFLSSSQSPDYTPQSGEIVGILKTLKENMEKANAQTEKDEADAAQSHTTLVEAKTAELSGLNDSIRKKNERQGELSTEIAEMMRDKTETKRALGADRDFLEDLGKECATKSSDFANRNSIRSNELIAIGETIKILNNDDSLDLFKKTLPGKKSASFIQVVENENKHRKDALKVIRQVQQNPKLRGNPTLDFIALALNGKKPGFDKVFAMIDTMIKELKQEQQADDDHKHHCLKELDKSADAKKGYEQGAQDAQTAVDKEEDDIASLVEAIKDGEDGIRKLDEKVKEAGENRKAEHNDYVAELAEKKEAEELLKFAKNRLYKFYNPDLYVEPEEEAAATSTQAPSLLQVDSTRPQKPKTWDTYQKKSGESTSVLQLLDAIIADLAKDNTEAGVAEQNSQQDYEALLRHSSEARAERQERLADQQGRKAKMEEDLENFREELKSNTQELKAKVEYIETLHAECDWLLGHYDDRKKARHAEIDQMNLAKGALKGAIFEG